MSLRAPSRDAAILHYTISIERKNTLTTFAYYDIVHDMKQIDNADQKEKTLQTLRDEILLLRSALTSVIGDDHEGAYRQDFVQNILRAAREIPQHQFQDKKSFLAELAKI